LLTISSRQLNLTYSLLDIGLIQNWEWTAWSCILFFNILSYGLIKMCQRVSATSLFCYSLLIQLKGNIITYRSRHYHYVKIKANRLQNTKYIIVKSSHSLIWKRVVLIAFMYVDVTCNQCNYVSYELYNILKISPF